MKFFFALALAFNALLSPSPLFGQLTTQNASGPSDTNRNETPSELTIVSATYGLPAFQLDVTDEIRALVSHGFVVLRAPWDMGKSDPAPGRDKEITIVFKNGGEEMVANFPHKRDIILPPTPVGFVIVSAAFGIADRWVDVTDAVRAQVSQGSLQLPAKWKLGSIDPARGLVKNVQITYLEDGVAKTAIFSQTQRVALP